MVQMKAISQVRSAHFLAYSHENSSSYLNEVFEEELFKLDKILNLFRYGWRGRHRHHKS